VTVMRVLFDILYRRHKGGLYRYLLRLCKDKGVADELFQDVWSNIIRSRERYQPVAKFSTFLYQVAHNRLIDHVRKTPEILLSLDAENEDAESLSEIIPADAGGQPEILVERKRLVETLVNNIEALPALQREAFYCAKKRGCRWKKSRWLPVLLRKRRRAGCAMRSPSWRDGLRGLR